MNADPSSLSSPGLAPSDSEFPVPSSQFPAPTRSSAPERVVALLEVLFCSDYPTQILLGATLAALGFHAYGPGGQLDLTYVVVLSLADSVVLIALIFFFVSVHRERFSELLLGDRRVGRELTAGLPLAFISVILAVTVLATIQLVAPGLHTVEHNPLQDLIQTPRDIALFTVVVVIAGGVREEVQRAFLLRRFERWLGGPRIGVVVASAGFGAGHLLQGADAAIATGILGAFWAVIYLRRRSVVAPVVSHSGFNLLQLAQALALGR